MKRTTLAAGARKNGKIKRPRRPPRGSSPTCPHCGKRCKSEVRDSRQSGDAIRRRRTCLCCGGKYTTYETTINGIASTDSMDAVRDWLTTNLLPQIEELFKGKT